MSEETSTEPKEGDRPDPGGESVEPARVGERELAEILEDAREDCLDFLEGLLDAMDVDGDVEAVISEDDAIQVNIGGPDAGLLIGRKGQTLDAIQDLLRTAVQRQARTRIRIQLDIEGYRERRREALQEKAEEAARDAVEGGEVELEPMSAYDRKIVHDAVARIDGVTSFSEGEEPRRRVIIQRAE